MLSPLRAASSEPASIDSSEEIPCFAKRDTVAAVTVLRPDGIADALCAATPQSAKLLHAACVPAHTMRSLPALRRVRGLLDGCDNLLYLTRHGQLLLFQTAYCLFEQACGNRQPIHRHANASRERSALCSILRTPFCGCRTVALRSQPALDYSSVLPGPSILRHAAWQYAVKGTP